MTGGMAWCFLGVLSSLAVCTMALALVELLYQGQHRE